MSSLLTNIETVPVETIETHPHNPRRGDIEVIASSLAENGQFQALVVQASTRYILAGNHTYLAAVSLGWTTMDVVFVDVDDTAAMKILLAANRTADLGGYNEMVLLSILADMREEDDELLLGTGYTNDDVDELLADALTFMPEEEEATEEELAFAAALLDRLMPPTIEEEVEAEATSISELIAEAEQKPEPKKPAYEVPSEFVIFRFGELRAKVAKEAYEEFLKSWLRDNDNDLPRAGIAAVVALGVSEDEVSLALTEGTERWF